MGSADLNTQLSTAPPRAELSVDTVALREYLAPFVPAIAGCRSLEVSQFSHGQSNPTYMLAVGGDPVAVLRRQPPGRILRGAHAVDREARVLRALAPTAVPVPRVMAECADRRVIGTPFYVMEHVAGHIHLDSSLPMLSPRERTAVYSAMCDTLSALHSVDVSAVGLADYGRSADYCARQTATWKKQYLASVSASERLPEMMSLIGWLEANIPENDAESTPSLVHGDFRLDNLIMTDDTHAVLAVLDWELSTLGNPLADLAYNCLAYHLPPGIPGMAPLPVPLPAGIPTEEEMVKRYCASRGISPPSPRDWAFFLALALFRVAAILAGVGARAAQGNASSAAAASMGSARVVASLAATAMRIVEAAGSRPGSRQKPLEADGSRRDAIGPAFGRLGPAVTMMPALQTGGSVFGLGQRAAELRGRLYRFMQDRVLPAEAELLRHMSSDVRWTIHPLTESLKLAAKAEGLWNLWLTSDLSAKIRDVVTEADPENAELLLGPGLSNLEYAQLCELTGVSVIAPEVFNCSAPDTGNMEVLSRYGTRAQQESWLLPLLRGDIRSCFAMTEMDVASSDATNIRSSITRSADGGSYVLRGRKWWTSGACDPRCRIAIFMGKTSTGGSAHTQQSMILVPMDTPGVSIVRPLLVFGYDDAPHGHAEVLFDGVRVPASNLLLGEGRGFEIAQGRLGPGRLHHCMRLIGAGERAMLLMAHRALTRATFGKSLSQHSALQEELANARVGLDGARLHVLTAAHALDDRGNKAARGLIAAAKIATPRSVLQVLDTAMQIHGGAGVSQDFPLAYLWAASRTLRLADGPDSVHLQSLAKMELKTVKIRCKL